MMRGMADLLSDDERRVAVALAALGRVNPFLPERRHWEREALGDDFVPGTPVWSLGEGAGDDPNLTRIYERATELTERLCRRLQRHRATPEERELYAQRVFTTLYARYQPELAALEPSGPVPFHKACLDDFRRFFRVCGPPDADVDTPEHLLACLYQIHRAFDVIFGSMAGGSMASARLRAATWQSIFSFDADRYRRYLFRSMPDVPTLITGATGTGKELVARAIGLSSYIPFDEARGRFAHPPTFLALNLAAMPAALVESELFGHRKGAFTGAVTDRQGWLARCPRGGAVFLDEIGELDPMLQVKLLRVLEDRTFSAVGDEAVQRFEGKILAATNRDLPAEIGAGTFRQDLYFRLRGDRIEMPTLRERLDDDPAELGRILRALVARMVPEAHAEAVARDVEAEIARARGPRWPWPGNVRELAQCARNVLVQGACGPAEALPSGASGGGPFAELEAGELSLAEVTRRYTRLVYERTGTYKAAAEVLGVDWRTVRAHVES